MLYYAASFAQDRTEDFSITLPEQKVSNSLYNKISYIDSRSDTSSLGLVQLGAFNKLASVVPKVHFSQQMVNVLQSLTDSTAKNGELLFQVRQLSFAELPQKFNEKGYFYLKANLYSKTNNRFLKIKSIDTIISIRAADVTRALFRNGSNVIAGFISNNLLKTPIDSTLYSFKDINRMDSIEKRKIKLYNVKTYTDGLYTSYESFKNQTPDMQATVEKQDIKVVAIYVVNEKGKTKKYRNKVFMQSLTGEYLISLRIMGTINCRKEMMIFTFLVLPKCHQPKVK